MYFYLIIKRFTFFVEMPTSCFEFSILELWANGGTFDEKSETEIFENLTQEKILKKINSQNTR